MGFDRKSGSAILLITLFSNIAGASGALHSTAGACREFAIKESPSSYVACVKYLKTVQQTEIPVRPVDLFGPKVWAHYLLRVGGGDEQSLGVAFRLYPLLDGAEAEDLAASIAQSVLAMPRVFLKEAYTSDIDSEYISAIVVTTPQSFADNNQKTMELYDRRLRAINGVKGDAFKATKKAVVEALEDELENIREVESELKKSGADN